MASLSSLWHPDLFFVNEMKLPIVNEENFVKISPGGEVLWSKRITKKISCSECKKESHKGSHQSRIEVTNYGHFRKGGGGSNPLFRYFEIRGNLFLLYIFRHTFFGKRKF